MWGNCCVSFRFEVDSLHRLSDFSLPANPLQSRVIPLSKDAGTGCAVDVPDKGLKSTSEDRLTLHDEAEETVGEIGLFDELREGMLDVIVSGFAAVLACTRASRRAFSIIARCTSCRILGSAVEP